MDPNPYVPPLETNSVLPKPAAPSTRHWFAVASLLLGAALGWFIWALSRSVTGAVEPWDSAGSYYFASLIAAGVLSTLVHPRTFWLGPLGVYLGQVAYMETVYRSTLPSGDPIILPAIIAVAIFGVFPVVIGALVTSVGWRLVRKTHST